MKKAHLIIIFITGLSLAGFSQAIEISGYGGYMLSGTADFYGYQDITNTYVTGEMDVKDGAVYGGTIGLDVPDAGMQIQFLWNINNVNSNIVFFSNNRPREVVELKIQHWHLGVEKYLGGNEMVKPYGAISLGITTYGPQNSAYETKTRFSGAIGAGLKVFPTEKIGLKFQAKMFLPMTFSGIGIYCGTGGCGGGSSFNVPIIHGEFSGGVILRIDT